MDFTGREPVRARILWNSSPTRPEREYGFMAEDVRDVMITGLRNAHALETQAIQILQRQAERLTDYPQLQSRLRQHLEESRGQQAQLERLLERFDAGTSTVKQAVMGLAANVQAMFHAMAEDEVLKNTF